MSDGVLGQDEPFVCQSTFMAALIRFANHELFLTRPLQANWRQTIREFCRELNITFDTFTRLVGASSADQGRLG